jgi:hypothetical protein
MVETAGGFVTASITRLNSFNGCAIPCYLYCDDKVVGQLGNNTTIEVSLPVGFHTLKTDRQPGGSNWFGLGANVRPALKTIMVEEGHNLLMSIKLVPHMLTCAFEIDSIQEF